MPIGGIPHPEFIDLQQWIDKYLKEIKLNYNEKRAALACSVCPTRVSHGLDSKHRRDIPFSAEHYPKIAASAVVSPSATLAGGVEVRLHALPASLFIRLSSLQLWEHSTVWNNAVLRGTHLSMKCA